MADAEDIPTSTGGAAPERAAPGKPRRTAAARLRRAFVVLAVVGLVAAGMSFVAIKARWWRAPYPPAGKSLCWRLGTPEEAYNFDAVVPGWIYRSGRPDERFYRYVRREYGIRCVIRLNGPDKDVPLPPEALGMEVTALAWSPDTPPPPEELAAVLEVMDGPDPVLVHCWSGADRTGYAVAAYRIGRQKWPVDQALREMNRYWHDREGNPDLQESLRALAATE